MLKDVNKNTKRLVKKFNINLDMEEEKKRKHHATGTDKHSTNSSITAGGAQTARSLGLEPSPRDTINSSIVQ